MRLHLLYRIIVGGALLLFAWSGCTVTPEEELARIKRNYAKMLLPSATDKFGLNETLSKFSTKEKGSDQVVVELFQRYPSNPETIRAFLSGQTDEGSWPDINYADKKRSGWEPRIHTERILELVRLYYTKESSYYHSPDVGKAVHKALGWWFAHKPVCLNWWYNQIGVPKTLGTACLLFEAELTPAEREGAIEVLKNARFGMTGQNKVWLAGNVLMRALLQNDFSLAKQARDSIVSEIVTGRPEGIQPDWSFHQHGPQQQFGNYGLSFLSSMSFYSGIFAGTSLELADNQLEIVRQLTDEGYRWILWKGTLDISALGRQFFQMSQIHKALGAAFAAVELGGGEASSCNATAKALCEENYGDAPVNTLIGNKHFYCSNYTIHRRPTWMLSVKMASRQIIGTETLNGDNMKGFYSADGATYLYQDGREYLDIFPLWDWRKLPGVTSFDTDASVPVSPARNQSDFVGGLSNGQQGMTVMDLNRAGIQGSKAWIFTDNFVLCLGAGIKADSTLAVTTAIEQCHRRGDLLLLDDNVWRAIDGRKQVSGQKEARFFHHNTGYIVWGDRMEAVASTEHRTGRWHDIMQMYPPKDVKGEVAQLYLNHGKNPRDASYQYVLLPDADCEKTEKFDLKEVNVLRNDHTAQAVALKDGHCWIAARQPVDLMLPADVQVRIKTPGIYQIAPDKNGKYNVLWTSPAQQYREASLQIDGKEMNLTDYYWQTSKQM